MNNKNYSAYLESTKRVLSGAVVVLTILLVIAVIYRLLDRTHRSRKESVQGSLQTSERIDGEFGAATLKYWTSANAIIGKEANVRRKTEDLGEWQTAMQTAAADFRSLPVTDVDSECVDLFIEISGWYSEIAYGYHKLEMFRADQETAKKRFGGPEALAEGFLRGMAGDPLGQHNEAIAEDTYLRQRYDALLSEVDAQERKRNALSTRVAKLRATLSNRYRMDFPQLDW